MSLGELTLTLSRFTAKRLKRSNSSVLLNPSVVGASVCGVVIGVVVIAPIRLARVVADIKLARVVPMILAKVEP